MSRAGCLGGVTVIWDWGFYESPVEKVQENKCIELAIEEKLLWGPSSVVGSSLKGEVLLELK